MTLDEIKDTVKDLREPYRAAIMRSALMNKSGSPRGLSQLIVGPNQSGKSTEARDYAKALAAAGLVAKKDPVIVLDQGMRSRNDWIELFKSAEGGVLIIDDIPRQVKGPEANVVTDLMLHALDESKCAVVLIGNDDEMMDFLDGCRPELRARLPAAIETNRPLTEEEIKERLERPLKREAARQAEAIARSSRTWRELADDVTLKASIRPMKAVTLLPRNETVKQ